MRVSDYYSLGRTQPYLDFVDIKLDIDVAVFVDPTAINSLRSTWGHELQSLLQVYFEAVLRNISIGNDENARALLSCLSERNEFHLGYSRGVSKGHAFDVMSAESVWGALSRRAKRGQTHFSTAVYNWCLIRMGE